MSLESGNLALALAIARLEIDYSLRLDGVVPMDGAIFIKDLGETGRFLVLAPGNLYGLVGQLVGSLLGVPH